MAYSLQSRDLIADGIETVMGAQFYDANISIPGCDKNMPGCIMAMARVNRPAVMVYGGRSERGAGRGRARSSTSSRPSRPTANTSPAASTTTSASPSCARRALGLGACGGMYTANTMASAIEALGLSVPYSSSIPAWEPQANGGQGALHSEKLAEVERAADALAHCIAHDIKPRDIMTKEAFENAVRLIMVTGGSTNATIHLIAMARSAGVDLTLGDFKRLAAETPFISDLSLGPIRHGGPPRRRRHAGGAQVHARRGVLAR